MAAVDPVVLPSVESVGDMLAHLGDISPRRIPLGFPIGSATEEDLIYLLDHSKRICELVDGVLVEKLISTRESILAGYIVHLFYQYLETNELGIVTVPDGALRNLPSQIRIPDVSFIRWARLPGHKIPTDPIFAVVPNIAIEILSPGNTQGEMIRKLSDYFTAGVELVWCIDPVTRTAQAFQAEDRVTNYMANDDLSAGEILPGFSLPLGKLFAKLDAVG